MMVKEIRARAPIVENGDDTAVAVITPWSSYTDGSTPTMRIELLSFEAPLRGDWSKVSREQLEADLDSLVIEQDETWAQVVLDLDARRAVWRGLVLS